MYTCEEGNPHLLIDNHIQVIGIAVLKYQSRGFMFICQQRVGFSTVHVALGRDKNKYLVLL